MKRPLLAYVSAVVGYGAGGAFLLAVFRRELPRLEKAVKSLLLRPLLLRSCRLVDRPALALDLPPLPLPDRRLRRREASVGVATIVSVIGFVLGLSHAAARAAAFREIYRAYFFLMYSCASLALMCLERILRGDPGVICRSRENCEPMPQVVREKLKKGQPLTDLRNVYHHQSRRSHGSSYCVRCLVWRPPKSHHCATCQRCVRHFDHHCALLGRCIAGTRGSGNIFFFRTLKLLGYASASLFSLFIIGTVFS